MEGKGGDAFAEEAEIHESYFSLNREGIELELEFPAEESLKYIICWHVF